MAALQDQGRADLAALAAEVEAAQAAVAEAEAGALRAEVANSSARQALDAVRPPSVEAERRVHRIEAEARTLRKLLDVDAAKLWPPVIDLITVAKGYEAALGAALGDDLDAPVDQAAPIRWIGATADPSDPALPDGAEPLATHVTAPVELARRLAQIGVVAREDGARLAPSLRPGQRLVSREGDLWRWDGFAAAADAPTAAARRLAEKNRLSDIARDLEAARVRGRGQGPRAQPPPKPKLPPPAPPKRRRALLARASARRRRGARPSCGRGAEANRLTAQLSALTEAKARLAASRDEAVAMKHEAAEALAALPPDASLEADLRASSRRGRVVPRNAVGSARGGAGARARGRAARAPPRDDRRRPPRLGRAPARRRGADRDPCDAAAPRPRAERAALDDAPAAFAEKRRALIGEIEAAEAARRGAADELAAAETALAEADRDARAALEAMSLAREEAARAEERFEGAKRRRADVAREIRDVLEIAPEEAAGLAEIKPGAPLADLAEIEATLDRLRRERERLGAVNLRAEEELREVEAQHNGLVTERDDLVEAIKRLRQGIQSLNREARERLLASFEVVNGHFKRLFERLFGGGTAELQLIENDDPLEAGLEIVAKPPGKKPQTLSLLSGGEQALTALALIFAVFLTNPAPICVLDEVDAPLDDHNVERFCDLLDEMTQATDTRFVIITHNPITMARMNRLYGVTMAERGVSQLVSVDLEGAVKIREAV